MIDSFSGAYKDLSNFAYVPVVFEGITYPTSEHAFQAAKVIGDEETRKQIAALQGPRQAKAAGRKIALRKDWEQVKEDIMFEILRDKFSIRNPSARATLISTGNEELVEGNSWHDNTWGDCYCELCEGIEGANLLGKTLMRVREEIILGRA